MGNNWTTLLQNDDSYIYGLRQNEDYVVNTNYVDKTDAEVSVNYRKGVRNGSFVIDEELYPLGFGDAQGIGWQNIYSIN
jgi:hypothetical protein